MFISKLSSWLEKVDPYYTQRIILRKALYLAVWLTFVNWIAKPDSFIAYATSAALLCGTYESPIYSTYREKDFYLVTAYLLCGVGCVSFYLLFPYKVTLLVYAVAFFLVLFFLSHRYYPKLKYSIMQIIMVSALNMSIQPEANPQIALDTFFCIMLSMITVFFALKLHNNLYRKVWVRAFRLYIVSISNDLAGLLQDIPTDSARNGSVHLNVIRAYRHLLPKPGLFNIIRATINSRQIAFAFMHLHITVSDRVFWEQFCYKLRHLAVAIEQRTPCNPLPEDTPNGPTQVYVNQCLKRIIFNWNKLCSIL